MFMGRSELANRRTDFAVNEKWVYLNHASIGPLPRCTVEMATVTARWQAEDGGLSDERVVPLVEDTRKEVAHLLNCTLDEIAFLKNTPEGLATVAAGLDWRAGDNCVTTGLEFPSNVYPWLNLADKGVEVRFARPVAGRLPLTSFLDVIDNRTRVVAVSHAQFSNGFRVDLAALSQVCRARDVYLVVDAMQSLGALPVDVRELGIDFLSAAAHKWLLGPRGVGIFFCRRSLLDRLRLTDIGQGSVVPHKRSFRSYRFMLKSSARRFETGMLNYPGIIGLGSSLKYLREVGFEVITARIKTLTDRLASGLVSAGCRLMVDRRVGEWSGVVSFVPPDPERLGTLMRRLTERSIVVSLREGMIRVSPHFYNTEDEIDLLLDCVHTDVQLRGAVV